MKMDHIMPSESDPWAGFANEDDSFYLNLR